MLPDFLEHVVLKLSLFDVKAEGLQDGVVVVGDEGEQALVFPVHDQVGDWVVIFWQGLDFLHFILGSIKQVNGTLLSSSYEDNLISVLVKRQNSWSHEFIFQVWHLSELWFSLSIFVRLNINPIPALNKSVIF